MKFYCQFVSGTGERKDLISTLDPGEVETVKRVRAAEGDAIAQVTAQAFVLKSAYRDVDAHEWSHLAPPQPVN